MEHSGAPSEFEVSQREHSAEVKDEDDWYVGEKVLCKTIFDGTIRPAEIIERRSKDLGQYSFYVHYIDCDKRLDEWVPVDRLSHPVPTGGGVDVLTPGLVSMPSLGPEAQGGDMQKMTRRVKRRHAEIYHVAPAVDDLAPIDQHLEKEHQEKTKVKNIQVIEMGKYAVDTWYYSPYPEDFCNLDKLYICEFTLKYFKKPRTLQRWKNKCLMRHPPGDIIYRTQRGAEGQPDPPVVMFEVDGKKDKIYCQNLCLLSKLFLDHKTLYYDVDPFLFYVLCEQDSAGYHIVGYFSKEKNSVEGYNLACILTLPPYQRKGYGRFLISFSYELSKKEMKVGTPERPLSDLGQVSYRSYWTRVVLDVLREHKGSLSVKDISDLTAIRPDDIIKTLESLNLIKYWKGDHIISVTPRIIEEHLKTVSVQKNIFIDPNKLHWIPYNSREQGGKK